jgi:hypothetical protein
MRKKQYKAFLIQITNMASLKARKLKDQSVVTALLKEITRRMEDFESSVSELKILKESAVELNDQILEQESQNVGILQRLRSELKENKLKALNDAAQELNKVLISTEELDELKGLVAKMRADTSSSKSTMNESIEKAVAEQVQHQLRVQELQHNCEKAQLSAANTNYIKQVENLNDTIQRMSLELESQKKLTADVCRVNQPHQQVQNTAK